MADDPLARAAISYRRGGRVERFFTTALSY